MSEPVRVTPKELQEAAARIQACSEQSGLEYEDTLDKIALHDAPLLLAEVERLRRLAGEFFGDLAYMGEHLFGKHHGRDLEENPWLAPYNPFPEGSPYFPETQQEVKKAR